jgi:type IV pilus assembly protein PilW
MTRKPVLWPAHRGFTLIELLVAVAIGMGLTLAITVMLVRGEAGRRALTSANDVSNNGAYLSFALDRMLRSAGSGYAQTWKQAFGCPLRVARSSTQILPRSTAFPAPFASVATTVRMAPLVAHAGIGADGSDVLIVGTGASGLGESPQRVLPGSATSTGLRVPSTVGLRGGDLVAVLQNGGTCLLQQVTAGFAGGADQQVNFSGTYYKDTIDGITLAGLASTEQAWLAPLGNVSGNQPAFQLLGIGANSTLFSYDLLRLDGSDTPVPIADGIVNLRVRYGVDTNDDGIINSWVDPAASPWTAAALLDGSATSQQNLARIVAVRVALVMRNSAPERDSVSPASLLLFSDLDASLQVTHSISSSDQAYRFRVLEFTVPLRNALMLPRS